MVPNSTQFPTPVAMVNLLHTFAPGDFYFTGSRYMGGARPDSDWDFMTEATNEMEAWLRSQGFTNRGGAYTNDHTVQVLEHVGTEGVVQVQLVKQVECKVKASEFIKANLFEVHLYLSHHERNRLWRRCYDACRWGYRGELDHIAKEFENRYGWRTSKYIKPIYNLKYKLLGR